MSLGSRNLRLSVVHGGLGEAIIEETSEVVIPGFTCLSAERLSSISPFCAGFEPDDSPPPLHPTANTNMIAIVKATVALEINMVGFQYANRGIPICPKL
jgi:hypothetical protein